MLARRAFEKDSAARERDEKAFTEHLAAKSLPPRWFATLERPKASMVYAAAERKGVSVPASLAAEAQAFWLRRSVDGTAAEFAETLRALVQAVDPDFVAGLAAGPADAGPPAAPAPAGPAAAPAPTTR